MKRIYFLLLFVLILIGCTMRREDYIDKDGINYNGTDKDVSYSSGVYHNKNWDELTGTYTKKVVPDAKTAVAIATAIFDAMDKPSAADTFTLQNVFYDEIDGIWIVSFWEEISDETTVVSVGYDCSIAINATNGEVLRIWFGE